MLYKINNSLSTFDAYKGYEDYKEAAVDLMRGLLEASNVAIQFMNNTNDKTIGQLDNRIKAHITQLNRSVLEIDQQIKIEDSKNLVQQIEAIKNDQVTDVILEKTYILKRFTDKVLLSAHLMDYVLDLESLFYDSTDKGGKVLVHSIYIQELLKSAFVWGDPQQEHIKENFMNETLKIFGAFIKNYQSALGKHVNTKNVFEFKNEIRAAALLTSAYDELNRQSFVNVYAAFINTKKAFLWKDVM